MEMEMEVVKCCLDVIGHMQGCLRYTLKINTV